MKKFFFLLNSFLSDNFKKKRTLTLYYSQVIVLSDEILRRVKDLARKFGNFDVGPNYNQRSGKKRFGGGRGEEGGWLHRNSE